MLLAPRPLALTGLVLVVSLAAPLTAYADALDPPPTASVDPPLLPVPEVAVTATRSQRGVLEVPGNVTVIDRDAIERSGDASLPELLRRQSGLFVTNGSTNPAFTTVEARGFNNGGSLGSSLLVLVDGRRANQADTGNTDWALLPLDLIEKIEIVRGPASSLYGDNAIGGVIEITTRRPEGPMQLGLIGRAGTYDTDNGSLFASAAAGPVGARVFASGSRTHAYRDGADYDEQTFDGALRLDVGEGTTLELAGGYHSDDRDLPGTLSLADIASFGRRAQDPGTSDESRVRNGFVEARGRSALSEELHLEGEAFRRDYHSRGTITFGGSPSDIDNDLRSYGVNARLRLDRAVVGLANRLVVGGEFLRETGDRVSTGGFSDLLDSKRRIWAAFLQNELDLTENLRLSGGVRFDDARYRLAREGEDVARPDHSLWSPKAALVYRVSPSVSAYASYARGFRLPNFDEDSPFFGPAPDLSPQESDAYEVGIKLRGERASADLVLYWMNVKDEIIYDPIVFTNANFPRVRHRGVESSLRIALTDWLEATGEYTFDDIEIRRGPAPGFAGERMPLTPRHRGDAALRALLPLGFDVTFRGRWVGNRVLANDFTDALPRLSKYAVYDALLAFRPTLDETVDLTLGFAVRNLFDRDYYDFGAAFDSGFGDEGFFYPAPDRTYEFSLSLTLHR